MKKLAILTTSLLAALLALGGTNAYAEESEETYYPEDDKFTKTLSFPQLSDYCIDGETYYFADGKTLNIFDGTQLTPYEHTANITALDFDEKVYFSDGESVYTLNETDGVYSAQVCEEEYSFTTSSVLTVENGIYWLNEGTLGYAETVASGFKVIEGNFSQLKQYGQAVYAISENKLNKIIGETAEPISFEFFYDYANENGVNAGRTAWKLQSYSLQFVNVLPDKYMTEVDLSSIGDENLTLGKTVKSEECIALLLCYTGNAAIIAIGDDSYVLHKDSVEVNSNVTCFVDCEFENATVIGNRIYASPYVIIGTSAMANASGMIVGVTRKLELENVLGSAFYEVVYISEGGSTKVGYVADGFLTEYIIEDNKQPEEKPDPDYSEDTNTKTILIVFAVVALVLIAVGYLTYAGTSGKHKNKKNKKESEKDKE